MTPKSPKFFGGSAPKPPGVARAARTLDAGYDPESDAYTTSRAAAILGVHPRTVRKLISRGILTATQVHPRLQLVHRASLDHFLRPAHRLTIAQAAATLGVNRLTIRRYIQRGLLTPHTDPTNHSVVHIDPAQLATITRPTRGRPPTT